MSRRWGCGLVRERVLRGLEGLPERQAERERKRDIWREYLREYAKQRKEAERGI